MKIYADYPLKNINTFGMNAYAGHFAAFSSESRLKELLSDKRFKAPSLVLGGGSNILITKNPESVIKNEITGIEKVKEDNAYVYIKAGAGEIWHLFVLYCLERQWAGIENLSLIPGNVGATPMQNIGAYGVEVKDVFYSLDAFHIGDNKRVTFSAKDCHFGYRDSIFKNEEKGKFVILNVTYKLRKQPEYNTSYGAIENELEVMGVKKLSIKAISDAVIRIRTSKLPDPKKIGNAGSFFKNPVVSPEKKEELEQVFPDIKYYPFEDQFKLAAGWMIEQCGWKGYRERDAGVHPHQALVLVNYGKAEGAEIKSLSEKIQQSVFQRYGVLLEREVNFV